MAVEKLEISQEDLASLGAADGYSPGAETETTTNEEEGTEETQVVEESIEEAQATVEEGIVPSAVAVEEPQLIIQEPEPIPAIEEQQPEATPVKVKAKVYNNQLVAALNKYVATVENPDPLEFVRQYQANYDNLDPVEVIRQEIVNDPYNKGLRPSAIRKLLDERLSKFDLESDDPEDRADAFDLLKREAEIVKARMIKSGREFVSQFDSDLEFEFEAPATEQKAGPTPEEVQAWREAKSAEYLPEVSKFVKNGVISIQDKDGTINIPAVNAQEYVDALLDPVGFITSVALNPDGTPNYGKWIQIVTAAKNSSAYQSTMIKHGIALGQQKIASKIKNESPLGQGRPVIEGGEPTLVTPNQDIGSFVKAMEHIRPWKRN